MMASLPLGAVVPFAMPAAFPGDDSIVGKHVFLERLSTKHTDDLYESIGQHRALWTYIPDGPFGQPSDFTQYIVNMSTRASHAFYGIVLKTTGKAAGLIGLFRADLIHRVIEVGAVLYSAALQRSIAGTEVLYLLGSLVFEELGYRRWEWKCDDLNMASQRAARRYGFIYEGTFRQHMIIKGRNRDTAWFSMVDGDWPVQKEVFETWLKEANFDDQGNQRSSLNEVRNNLMKARHQ